MELAPESYQQSNTQTSETTAQETDVNKSKESALNLDNFRKRKVTSETSEREVKHQRLSEEAVVVL